MTNLNARMSMSNSNSYHANGRSSTLPVPGTPRGVHGMSSEDLAADEKVNPAPGLPKTKVKRTWYGKKKVIIVPDLEALEGVPEKRPAVLYAPIYNGLAFGLSVCKWLVSFGSVWMVVDV